MSATDPSTWRTDESSAALYVERTNFAAVILTGAALGTQTELWNSTHTDGWLLGVGIQFMLVVDVLAKSLSRKAGGKIRWSIVAYVCAMFVLSTGYLTGTSVWAQEMWIADRYIQTPSSAERYLTFLHRNYPWVPTRIQKRQRILIMFSEAVHSLSLWSRPSPPYCVRQSLNPSQVLGPRQCL